jgi:type II secretory pathway component PulC
METPALGQKGPPVPLSGEPVRDDQDTVGSHPPKIQKDTETQANTTSPGEKKTGSQIVTEERQGVPEIAGKPKNIPTESPTTPSSLKVSGIVWSEDPSNRLAVINGISVTEGAFIEGIKVVEIYATRVRFLYNDQPFEVPLGTTKVMK